MTNCTCTVTECKHNDDHCCCKSEILVNTDSKNDCSCGCTCCASFDQKLPILLKTTHRHQILLLKLAAMLFSVSTMKTIYVRQNQWQSME